MEDERRISLALRAVCREEQINVEEHQQHHKGSLCIIRTLNHLDR